MIRYLVAGIASPYGDCHTITSLWILDFIWVNSDCLKQFIENLEELHTWHHESPRQAWKRETAQRAVSLRDGLAGSFMSKLFGQPKMALIDLSVGDESLSFLTEQFAHFWKRNIFKAMGGSD